MGVVADVGFGQQGRPFGVMGQHAVDQAFLTVRSLLRDAADMGPRTNGNRTGVGVQFAEH